MGIRLIPRQALPGLLADDAGQGEKADGAVEATPDIVAEWNGSGARAVVGRSQAERRGDFGDDEPSGPPVQRHRTVLGLS